jgi:hypothetical protein
MRESREPSHAERDKQIIVPDPNLGLGGKIPAGKFGELLKPVAPLLEQISFYSSFQCQRP